MTSMETLRLRNGELLRLHGVKTSESAVRHVDVNGEYICAVCGERLHSATKREQGRFLAGEDEGYQKDGSCWVCDKHGWMPLVTFTGTTAEEIFGRVLGL